MATARVFKSGDSQVIQLPKDFQIDAREVEIFRRGDEIVLREKKRSAAEIFDALASFSEDFMADGREDLPPQERETL